MSSCHFVRYFYWNYADINDGKKFPAFTIENQNKVFDFKHSSEDFKLTIPEKFISDKENTDFNSFLEKHETVAFLVIRDDTILYEKYFSPARTCIPICPDISWLSCREETNAFSF